MKRTESYYISEIEWDDVDKGNPEEIELPIWDSDLSKSDEDYSVFSYQMEKNEEDYYRGMSDIGFNYLQSKFPDDYPDDFIVSRYTHIEIEESDVIGYINNLTEDELDEFFKKIG